MRSPAILALLLAFAWACSNTNFASSSSKKGEGKDSDSTRKGKDADDDDDDDDAGDGDSGEDLGKTGKDGSGDGGGAGTDSQNAGGGGLIQTEECLKKKADNYNIALIFDNSGSQRHTDPQAVRRDGALSFVDQFSQYVSRNKKARVYMVVLSFDTKSVRGAKGWVKLNGANADEVKSEITNATSNPDGGTAYSPVLRDTATFYDQITKAVSQERTKNYVVFLTDGLPNGCDEDINNIAALASAARTSHGVLTYAVGLEGSAENQMDTIAVAGGTNKGIFIGSSANAQAELLAALKAIQGSQVSCEFQMPAPKDGSTLDPKKVNVNYTPGGGSTQTLGQVGGAADCANGGWYYDNPTSPSKITLCPSTCSTVQADKAAKMEILLGCATQLQPPPS